MDAFRLIEPMGLVFGQAAQAAVTAGFAHWLVGGPAAFTLARLIGDGTSRLVPASDIPSDWLPELARMTAPLPSADLPDGPQVMGILNVTPDSFSDGGRHFGPEAAMRAGIAMVTAGAGLLDIGGESTRPGSAVVTPDEEWARIAPVFAELRIQTDVALSVDTRNARTMASSLGMGATLINDVSALMHDPYALAVVADAACPVVLMHMRGTPQTMGRLAVYDDVAVDVVRELSARIDEAVAAGIARDRIIIDPGIGFAKNGPQNAELLARLPILANLGCRVLLGTSRKRMLGDLAHVPVASERDPGTLVSSLPGLALGNPILRVHNVASMIQAVRVWQGLWTCDKAGADPATATRTQG
ncbi:dihydropteroate synthase [Gluconacetobacter johannae DSM 13595]|uniref:dihydropteroate synthase n=1 Tax=Gluconacetobacter johannae TaxID=112140 RepID=A0A7W4P4V6_9PROT|nr:dihydropteroate synthase [Gluconacetobacter johannae]MBB2175498.1 dihydropteroate synthase [Gluconacetobacter johannae]GBQ89113.1 dihydropteroate synthase [Gluconacetobacter johannae DSM 13595]